MKTTFWKADWFLGLVIAIAVFGFSRASGFIPGLERWAYDLGVNMTSKTPSDKIAVIAIDDQSIANIGRWPWPREVQAKLIEQLAAAKAKVIGNTVFFFEPQKDPGLVYVEKMMEVYNKAWPGDANQEVAFTGTTPTAAAGGPGGAIGQIGSLLREASFNLNGDIRMALSVRKAGNVLVPMAFEQVSYSPPQGKPDAPLPEYVAKNTIGGFSNGGGQFMHGLNALVPIEQIGAYVAGIGFLNSSLDEDGA